MNSLESSPMGDGFIGCACTGRNSLRRRWRDLVTWGPSARGRRTPQDDRTREGVLGKSVDSVWVLHSLVVETRAPISSFGACNQAG